MELAPRPLIIELSGGVPALRSVDELVPIMTILCPAEFVVKATRAIAEPVPIIVEKPTVSVMA